MPRQQSIDSATQLQPRGIGHGALFANGVAALFYFTLPLFNDVHWHGLENYHASPSTLITINHKRDLDILLIAPTLHLKKTIFREPLRMYFVARDDLFEPGFLTAHFPFSFPLGRLLHRVNLAPVMHAFSGYPISSVIHKRLGPLVKEVMQSEGDIRLGDTVKPDFVRKIAEQFGKEDTAVDRLTLSGFLGYEFRTLHEEFTDTGILKEGLARKVRRQSILDVEDQLRFFAGVLKQGGICLLSPEGRLSPDGHFWPVRSGLYRLLSLAGLDVTILPVNTTYDFMTRKRMRAHVAAGPEIKASGKFGKVELEQRVQRAIISLGRVTIGQIGSEYLLWRKEAGKGLICEDEFAEALSARALVLKNAGLNLDEQLTEERAFLRRLRDFLDYCVGKKILVGTSPRDYLINRDCTFTAFIGESYHNPVVYSHNELKSLLEHGGT
jgi:1-acyl-sn-glycerol-3-phosphate acyltransferase